MTPEQQTFNRRWQSVRFNYTESEPVGQLRYGHLVWVTYYAEPWPERKTVIAQLLETRCHNTTMVRRIWLLALTQKDQAMTCSLQRDPAEEIDPTKVRSICVFTKEDAARARGQYPNAKVTVIPRLDATDPSPNFLDEQGLERLRRRGWHV